MNQLSCFLAADSGSHTLKRTAISLAITLALAGTPIASGQQVAILNDGSITTPSGDAIDTLLRGARSGDAAAAVKLAVAYQYGRGIGQDYFQALLWYEVAAEKKNAVAMNNLGVMYALGHGVQVDQHEALKWYFKAALKKLPTASWNLSRAYAAGAGVPKSPALALAYTREAADAGYPPAMVELGAIYQLGQILPQDHVKSLTLYRTAAERHYPDGIFFLGRSIAYGLGTTKDLNAGIALIKRAEQMGSKLASTTLAHLSGQGVDVQSVAVAALPIASTSTLTDAGPSSNANATPASATPAARQSSNQSSAIGDFLEVLAAGLLVGLLVVGAAKSGGANSAFESGSSSFEPLSSSFALPSTTRSDAKAPARQVQDQPLFREIDARVRGEPSQRFRGDVDRYGNVTMRRVGETDPERVYRGAWDRSGEFKIRDQSGREARVYSE